MSTWLIYRHINKINNKSYIGLTKQSASRRWQNGLGYSKSQPLFYRAIKKYGWENFTHEILEENLATLQEAAERESFWIAHYHTWCRDPNCMGYNLTTGGEGTPGHIVSEETKRKISEANCGKIRSTEFKQRLSVKMTGDNNPFYGKTHTEETKIKISKANLGRRHTEAAKQKISAACQGRPVTNQTKDKLRKALLGKNKGNISWNAGKVTSEETKRKISATKRQQGIGAKRVLCVETNNVFNSITDAARFANIANCTLSSCLAGRANTAGKYHWRFVDTHD
jgi:group I intron endonuclease